jgi:hypothetical protein
MQLHMLRRDLPLEMLCALLNNNVDCYNQSLEFTEHVQVSVFWGGGAWCDGLRPATCPPTSSTA